MQDISVLIGGKAGTGINSAGSIIARIFSACGLRAYMYYDYPSLIKGGHNFAIIRAADREVRGHREKIDLILAMDQETVRRHAERLGDGGTIIMDAGAVKGDGIGVDLDAIVREESAPPITRNSALIGAFCRACGIPWTTVEEVLTRAVPKEQEANLRVARRGYETSREVQRLPETGKAPLPALSGNDAIAFGLLDAGLEGYVAYPMTPSSSILHTLAALAGRFGISVVHPENEIAVMLTALGAAYAGRRVAVGTSGGGFCLMTEGFSLAGMAEIPALVVLAQRPGPSTGVPTYSAQGDLFFALSAGQGEFPRIVAAPGTAEEAWYWAGALLDLAWKFQTPTILLTDKNLGEGLFSFGTAKKRPAMEPTLWDGVGEYARYRDDADGISPLAFPGIAGVTVKTDSYAHDERGITTEDPAVVAQMADKLLKKGAAISRTLEDYPCVETAGDAGAKTALLCWGSTAGVCTEVGMRLGLRVVRPVVLSPFPEAHLKSSLAGTGQVVAVEENSTGQLASLASAHGVGIDTRIGKYDGRPFAVEELERRLHEVIA